MNKIELIGLVGSIIIMFSMCFKTTTVRGSSYMRLLNLLGSIAFIVYGFLLPAYSTAVLNIVVSIINLYHLVILCSQLNSRNS